MKQLIENGISNFNATKKNIALVCFYAGNPAYSTHNDNVADLDSIMSWYEPSYATFRLCGNDGLIQNHYISNHDIDTTKEYQISFISNIRPDVKAEFLFNNKLFVCKELEYRINQDGIHPEITGIFYAKK